MNKIFKAIIFGVIAGGAAILGSSEKAVMAQSDYYYIQAKHSGQCLNVLNGGQNNGDNVVQGEECSTSNFQWSIIPANRRGYYYIQSRHSGQCLNVLNGGQNNGDNVVQGDACNTPNFQWSIIPAGRNSNYIEARHSGQCLNVLNGGQNNGDNVVQGEECGTENFQWSIIPVRNFRPNNSNYPWHSPSRDRDNRNSTPRPIKR